MVLPSVRPRSADPNNRVPSHGHAAPFLRSLSPRQRVFNHRGHVQKIVPRSSLDVLNPYWRINVENPKRNRILNNHYGRKRDNSNTNAGVSVAVESIPSNKHTFRRCRSVNGKCFRIFDVHFTCERQGPSGNCVL